MLERENNWRFKTDGNGTTLAALMRKNKQAFPTTEALSDDANVPTATIGRLKAGKTGRRSNLEALLEALGVDADDYETYIEYAGSQPLPPTSAPVPASRLRPMTLQRFVGLVKDDCDVPIGAINPAKYALFLGSGCSISSGIPTGTALVRDKWLLQLHDAEAPGTPFEEWVLKRFPRYTANSAGELYSEVMAELFPTPARRQREIERICTGINPAFEYAQLASLVTRAGGQFNVVLTTNFDDLITDALYLFAKTHPLVIHHAALADYIMSHVTRPLVVKLHGDNRLSPFNTPQELERLDETTTRHVADLVRGRALIFMGYGGWDEGIANMLRGLEKDFQQHGVFWVNDSLPGGKLKQWLEDCQAWHVTPGRFDQVMIELTNALDLPKPNQKWIDDVFQDCLESIERLTKETSQTLQPATPEAQQLRSSVETFVKTFDSWWAASLEADLYKLSDPDKADRIYQAGLKQYPNSHELMCNYAVFLKNIRKDYDSAESYYKQALEEDPKDADYLGNYAVFLETIRKDYDSAESYYKQALEEDPKHANNLGNYAVFLTKTHKDYDSVELYFKQALKADSKHANNLGNYANFLTGIRKDYDQAEAYYKQALEEDPNSASKISNYAYFLKNIRKDKKGEAELRERLLVVEAEDAQDE